MPLLRKTQSRSPPPGPAARAAAIALAMVCGLMPLGTAAQALDRAPNLVAISPRLVTSGQPSAEALAGLAAQGFEAVLYLAPPTVQDAVRDEPLLVAKQGLTFVNIPIRFDNPTESDFETVAAVLHALAGRKVLVHCQINLRASTMVFLYRAITLKEDPRAAYESVARVWAPEGAWKALVQRLLQKHHVNFDPF